MDREFLDQVRDHGKMVLLEHKKARVWLMQCIGLFRRVGTLHNEDLSPFVSRRAPTGKNVRREHGTLVEWGPVQKIGDAASDIEQQAFWQNSWLMTLISKCVFPSTFFQHLPSYVVTNYTGLRRQVHTFNHVFEPQF